MINKPRLSIDIYNQYVQYGRSVLWPDDPKERALLARALFGRELMYKFDYWIKHAIDLLVNPEPSTPFPRRNKVYLEEKNYRENLRTLNADQKQAVRNLIRKTANGILFGILVTLDQSCFGKFDLTLTPSQTIENSSISLFADLPEGLHDELNDWIISFSEFSDEIVELVQHPKGWWHFQRKEYF